MKIINMAKLYTIIVIIAFALALVVAEPPRYRQSKRFGNLKIQNNRKTFARQEQAPEATPSPAPYPPAGVTPEIPFDLPTETEAPVAQPDETYGPPEPTPDETYGPPEPTPDQTYGPPEPTPDQTYGPPEAEDAPAITEPDNTYGPPTTDDQPAIEEPEAEEIPQSESSVVSENLIQPRNKNIRASSKPAKLRSRSSNQRLRSAPVQSSFNTVEIIHSEPVLIYTLH